MTGFFEHATFDIPSYEEQKLALKEIGNFSESSTEAA
jgi:hypothetical protein